MCCDWLKNLSANNTVNRYGSPSLKCVRNKRLTLYYIIILYLSFIYQGLTVRCVQNQWWLTDTIYHHLTIIEMLLSSVLLFNRLRNHIGPYGAVERSPPANPPNAGAKVCWHRFFFLNQIISIVSIWCLIKTEFFAVAFICFHFHFISIY